MPEEKFYQVPPAFSVNLGEIQEDEDLKVEETVFKKEEFTKVENDEEDVIEETPEETPEEETEEDEYKDYSEAARIALLEIENGMFELDKKDIPKDLDTDTLRRLYGKNSEIKLKQEVDRLAAAAGEAEKYVKFLIEGGDPQAVKSAMEFKDLLVLNPDEESDQKILITQELKQKGLPDDEIEDLVSSILDKGKGKQRAETALKNFQKAENDYLENYREAQRQQAEYEQQVYNEYVTDVKKIIGKGEISGIKISKKDQKDLYDMLFTPTEIVTVKNEVGKDVRVRATKFQVLQNEMNRDREKVLGMALWLMKGSNFDFAKQEGKEEEAENLFSVLNRSKPPKENKERKSNFDNLVNSFKR